jgi:hypothetical protein
VDVCRARYEGLALAVEFHAGRDEVLLPEPDEAVLRTASIFAAWLLQRPAKLALTVSPLTFEQGDPSRHHPTKRTGDIMSVTLTDTEQVAYAVKPEDSKGFQVADTLTWSSDDAGAVLTVTPAADGLSCVFAAVSPGSATITVSDGTLSGTDLVTVTAGAVASLVLTPGTPAAIPPVA